MIQHVDCEAQIPAAIAYAEACGAPHRVYLLRERLAGRIGLFEVFRDTPAAMFKKFAALVRSRPALVVVVADDGLGDGPEAWPLARRMVQWAAAIVLHGSGAEILHYRIAVGGAIAHCRGLLIECEAAALDSWIALIQSAGLGPAVLVIKPSAGVHPVARDRGAVQ